MQKRVLGKTGLEVSAIGFGTAELGFKAIPINQCDEVLNTVLDSGINLIDTASCYMDSEEKIGMCISQRHDDYILVTKAGHNKGAGTESDWSADSINECVEKSLSHLKIDYIDVLMIHSCPLEFLRREELIGAMLENKQAGKTRFIGYSGDDKAAEYAVKMDVFDCIECSVNICDQQALSLFLPQAEKKGLGVFAKRPIANACWKDKDAMGEFYYQYAQSYVDRLGKMGFTPESLGFEGEWAELALRFTAFAKGVHCAIIGSADPEHIKENIAAVEKGPLPENINKAIKNAWQENDDGNWIGMV